MAPQLADDPEITTFIDPFGQLNIFYNKSEGLFTDVRAREAVVTAINKEGYASSGCFKWRILYIRS